MLLLQGRTLPSFHCTAPEGSCNDGTPQAAHPFGTCERMLHIAMIAVLSQTSFHTPTSILVAHKGRTVRTCQLHVGTWEQHTQLGVAGLQDVGLVPNVGAGHHLHHGLLQLALEGRQVHPLPRLHHHLAARRPLRKIARFRGHGEGFNVQR